MRIALILLAFSLGLFLGSYRATEDIISEVETWHIARYHKDGSWVITYKNGTVQSGCAEGGLCND